MIYGQLMGGMGNQLFIYSFCKRLVKETGQDAILYFDSEDGRLLEINHFSLDEKITIVDKPFLQDCQGDMKLVRYTLFRKIISHLYCDRLKNMVIREATRFGVVINLEGYWDLDFRALRGCKDIIFCGFMQSEAYFNSIAGELTKELADIKDIAMISNPDAIKTMVQKLRRENSLCIHIRRGDYLSDKYRERYFVCAEDYYRSAIEYIEPRVQNLSTYIFSDSIDWVRENMKFLERLNPQYIDGSKENTPIPDFLMMKACHHFIISNSSFSWWAQYLGEAEDKIVVAPSRWLNYGYDNQAIYQETWKLIEV